MSILTSGAISLYHPTYVIHKGISVSDSINQINLPIEDEMVWKGNSIENNVLSKKTLFASYPEDSRDNSTKNSAIYKWTNFEDSQSNSPDTRQDDGVVLLVGLFNLLAIGVYAAQEFLLGTSRTRDKRIILWQVQKVLDELVLRVHSSNTAASLISRALRASSSYEGRQIDSNSISSVLNKIFQEKDPVKLKEWLDNLKSNLMNELSSSKSLYIGPKMDPRVYRSLQNLYNKITATRRTGRSFPSSILQEVGGIAKTASRLSLNDIQSILKILNQLGMIQRSRNILPLLTNILPHTSIASNSKKGNPLNFHKNEFKIVRMRRSEESVQPRQRLNSRYPRLSSVPDTHTTKLQKDHGLSIRKNTFGNSYILTRRQGTIESIPAETLPRSWADKWFSLLTQVSPIALDFTKLYSISRANPGCLRILVCNSNKYWRNQSPFHAAVGPFLSVITSWALENLTPHSLGDSLIAIRAGWMGKDCSSLSRDCPRHVLGSKLSSSQMQSSQSILNSRESEMSESETPSVPMPKNSLLRDHQDNEMNHTLTALSEANDSDSDYENLVNYSEVQPVRSEQDHPNHDFLFSLPDHYRYTNEIDHNYNFHTKYQTNHPHSMSHFNVKSPNELTGYGSRNVGNVANLSSGRKKSPRAKATTSEAEFNYDTSSDDSTLRNHNLYHRYDSPHISEGDVNVVLSESVSGMALQDRPLTSELHSENSVVQNKTEKLQAGTPIDNRENKLLEISDEAISGKRHLGSDEITFPRKDKLSDSPASVLEGSSKSELMSSLLKYKYGVRRGLPTGNSLGLVESNQL